MVFPDFCITITDILGIGPKARILEIYLCISCNRNAPYFDPHIFVEYQRQSQKYENVPSESKNTYRFGPYERETLIPIIRVCLGDEVMFM